MNMLRLVKRLILTVFVFFGAATLNFFLPRLTGNDPVSERIAQLGDSGDGMSAKAMQALMDSYTERFGFDQPILQQYLTYMGDMLRLDFGYSLAFFPTRVWELIAQALPWTIGLMVTTTLISFAIGSIIGALAVWKNNKLTRIVMPTLMIFAAVPFYLVGLVLIYFIAFQLRLLPTGGGFNLLNVPTWSWNFAFDVLYHATLPAISIILSSVGVWALSMRGMMVTIQGEDYMTFAEARGLAKRRMFFRYGMRNAMLPQITTLGLALGQVVTGAILVEIVFAYPGLGNLLLQAVRGSDYFVIYGIVMVLVLAISIVTLMLDLIYPLLDPRVR
tara:strand:- start:78 stop:1070 length:993 start_codon:yes stop_codon:yes gene_type:complete